MWIVVAEAIKADGQPYVHCRCRIQGNDKDDAIPMPVSRGYLRGERVYRCFAFETIKVFALLALIDHVIAVFISVERGSISLSSVPHCEIR